MSLLILSNVSDKDLTFYLMDNKVALKTDNLMVITKLLMGEFPNFERVIPTQMDINVDLHREELIQLLRQVSLFTLEAGHSVRFSFQPGELVLTANSMQIGDRIGFMRFGSRVDLILPQEISLEIEINQKVIGNQTVIGAFNS